MTRSVLISQCKDRHTFTHREKENGLATINGFSVHGMLLMIKVHLTKLCQQTRTDAMT